MHHDHIEALHMVRDLGLRIKPEDVAAVDVSVHPPFTDLRTVQTLVEKEGIPVALGAQHCSDEDAGARTGEVSPRMLARLGTRYVIVGHSERRTLFGMTDTTVAATLRAVLRHDMVAHRVRGRDRGRARRGQDRVQARGAGAGGPRRVVARARRRARGGLRAPVGHRHRAGRLRHGCRGRGGLHPQPRGETGW